MFLVSVPLSGCSLLCKMAYHFILPCSESGFVVRTRRGENEVKGTGGTVPWLWRWVLNIVPTQKRNKSEVLETSRSLALDVDVCSSMSRLFVLPFGMGKGWERTNGVLLIIYSNGSKIIQNWLLGKPWFGRSFINKKNKQLPNRQNKSDWFLPNLGYVPAS